MIIRASLSKDDHLLWGMLCWHRSRHSNEMTSFSILLAAVFLGIVSFFSTIAHGSSFCQYLPQCSWSLSKIYHSVFEIFWDKICMVRNTVTLLTYLETSDFGRLLPPTSCHFHCQVFASLLASIIKDQIASLKLKHIEGSFLCVFHSCVEPSHDRV